MYKPLPLCLLLAVATLSACGNKGDLFLPSDPQLGNEVGLGNENDELIDSVEDGLDEDEAVKRSDKRAVPSQPTQ